MKLIFPSYANLCLETIENNGFEAWFVGGSVRDALLSRAFFDIDITTNARPEEIAKIFPNTIPTGIKHGTVTVIIDGHQIEVTTFRSDKDYSDSRHPNAVEFENSIESDLSRRDFTINALAYHPKRGILDLFDGIEDLNMKRIVAVGNPSVRFGEDALRILRAFRFSSQLSFEIEKNTLNAAYSCAENLIKLSGERVLSELKKLSQGDNPEIIANLINYGYLKNFGILSITNKIKSIDKIALDYRPSALLSVCNLDINVLRDNLKPDNELLRRTLLFKDIVSQPLPQNKSELKRIFMRIGDENLQLYLEAIRIITDEEGYNHIAERYREILANNEPFLPKHLIINGNDILKLGYKGEEIGRILTSLCNMSIDDPSINNKTTLCSLINKI